MKCKKCSNVYPHAHYETIMEFFKLKREEKKRLEKFYDRLYRERE